MPSASTSAADSPAGQAVGDERRALRRLLGHSREAGQHMHRRAGGHAGQPSRQFVADAGEAGHPSGQNHVARGRRRDGKQGDRFDGTLEIRVAGELVAR